VSDLVVDPATQFVQRAGRSIDLVERLVLDGLLIGCPLLLLICAISGYWLVERALRPVVLITRTANQISETDLRQRIAWQGNDELGRLSATFDSMLGRLQAAFERQRQFIADASHELRTPLTVINLEVNQALARRRSPEEYEQTLATVRSENDHMVRLVNNLLTLTKADTRQVSLRYEAVDLSNLALEVVERLAPIARQQSITLSIGELCERVTRGDRLFLTQMLTNLVENAIKYTCGSGDRVCVETESCLIDEVKWHCLRVQDDGPGIAAEHLPHLFERFYRVDASRSLSRSDASTTLQGSGASTGSGLGLSIVKWVAESHGGGVSVSSIPGSGSTFEVLLRAFDEQQAFGPPPYVPGRC
jgi:signal transduction histidine kinase